MTRGPSPQKLAGASLGVSYPGVNRQRQWSSQVYRPPSKDNCACATQSRDLARGSPSFGDKNNTADAINSSTNQTTRLATVSFSMLFVRKSFAFKLYRQRRLHVHQANQLSYGGSQAAAHNVKREEYTKEERSPQISYGFVMTRNGAYC